MDCGVTEGYLRDEMARQMLPHAYGPGEWLFTGKIPTEGMKCYLNVTYEDHGFDGEDYRSWARFVAHVKTVKAPPPVGKYATYEGESKPHRDVEYADKWDLPESLFATNDKPSVIEHFGAVHGQELICEGKASCDDEHLEQLEGTFDITLVCNDHLDNMWEVKRFCRRGGYERPTQAELDARPPKESGAPLASDNDETVCSSRCGNPICPEVWQEHQNGEPLEYFMTPMNVAIQFEDLVRAFLITGDLEKGLENVVKTVVGPEMESSFYQWFGDNLQFRGEEIRENIRCERDNDENSESANEMQTEPNETEI